MGARQSPSHAAERIGIFGGSFDPPHVGHLLALTDAIEQLSLDRVQVVPAGIQPLKGPGATDASHRLAMARLCFAGLPQIVVDPIEIARSGLSFMVETAEQYAARWPGAELYLLLGADAASALDRWRAPEQLLRLVHLVVLERAEESGTARAEPWRKWPAIRPPRRLGTRRVDVSSSEIRARVASGRSICGFVPESVASYLAANGLYLLRNAC